MSSNVKITKRLIFFGILSLLASVGININMEMEYIVLNVAFISNNLLLTIFGGICTGLVVVIAEKVYQYGLDKTFIRNNLYINAEMLYADLYYLHRNIKDLLSDKSLSVPQNLLDNKMPVIQSRLCNIANTDYCSFWGKDNLFKAHIDFQKNSFMKIKNYMDQSIYLHFAFNELKQIDMKNPKNSNAVILIYDTLEVFDSYIESSIQMLLPYLESIEKDDPKKYNWTKDKGIIHNSYLGVYNTECLEDFLKKRKSSNE